VFGLMCLFALVFAFFLAGCWFDGSAFSAFGGSRGC